MSFLNIIIRKIAFLVISKMFRPHHVVGLSGQGLWIQGQTLWARASSVVHPLSVSLIHIRGVVSETPMIANELLEYLTGIKPLVIQHNSGDTLYTNCRISCREDVQVHSTHTLQEVHRAGGNIHYMTTTSLNNRYLSCQHLSRASPFSMTRKPGWACAVDTMHLLHNSCGIIHVVESGFRLKPFTSQ